MIAKIIAAKILIQNKLLVREIVKKEILPVLLSHLKLQNLWLSYIVLS